MKVEQLCWNEVGGWSSDRVTLSGAQLVLVFAESHLLKNQKLIEQMRSRYPGGHFFGCSTAGEMMKGELLENTFSVTALEFQKTSIQTACLHAFEAKDSYAAGIKLSAALDHQDLTHVLVLSVGNNIDAGDLTKGLVDGFPKHVTISGGVAGDSNQYKETVVVSGVTVGSDIIAIVGFYGSSIQIDTHLQSGWQPFGTNREVTRSKNNALYELDGEPALEIYKRLLGNRSVRLPRAGLLFPLLIAADENFVKGVVRAVVDIDVREQSVLYAGPIVEGSSARFLKTTSAQLIQGAASVRNLQSFQNSEFVLAVGCVGRRYLLRDLAQDEVRAICQMVGRDVPMTGFYSYGEISGREDQLAILHNQMLVLTSFRES